MRTAAGYVIKSQATIYSAFSSIPNTFPHCVRACVRAPVKVHYVGVRMYVCPFLCVPVPVLSVHPTLTLRAEDRYVGTGL